MPWWGWMIIGAILLAAELLGVEAAFYLIFIGVAALIVGAIGLAGFNLEIWIQWILFAVLSVVSMAFFRRQLYAKLRPSAVGYQSGPAGETVTLHDDLGPGKSGRLQYRGSEWTVVNDSSESMTAGDRVLIDRVDGLKLNLKPIKD